LSFFAELRRRNVIRMAGVYLVSAWMIIQVAETLLPAFDVPAWVLRAIVLVLALGFLPALAFSWVFEMTPEGLKRESEIAPDQSIALHTGKRLNRLFIAMLIIAVLYLGLDKFVFAPVRDATRFAGSLVSNPVPAQGPGEAQASIAVLPFVDMSQAKDQEYFSDGLSEELLNLLAQLPQLRVIARTSSFSFKDKEVDVATIAKTLNVDHVLEGSVRKSGNTLRITAQLIRASDSSHIWSQTYDRELTDLFKVQDEIASAVVDALKLKLLPVQRPSGLQRTANADAYQLYLLGKDVEIRGEHARAVRVLRQAVAMDPGYANAWAELAIATDELSNTRDSPADAVQDVKLAFAAAERAIALAPGLAQGYASRGLLRYNRSWDWQGSRADFERAYALDPGNVALLGYYATNLFFIEGRHDQAIAMSRKATVLDPLSVLAWEGLGRLLQADGQTAAANEALRQAIGINPGATWANYLLGYDELKAGKADRALTRFRLIQEDPWVLAGTAVAEYTLGHARESRQALETLESQYAAGFGFQIAAIHAWRGESDQAFEWLERAYEHHDAGMARLRDDPTIASLRDDPRFAALVKKMDFPE
jgi:adenylate cyclase